MLRDRLIFVLFYCDGYFVQSRNFRLQKVGNIDWLASNYKFFELARSIDELIVVDLSKGEKQSDSFLNCVERLVKGIHIPLGVGGGIKNLDQVVELFKRGADKIVLNTALFDQRSFVKKFTSLYGTQALVASIDYRVTNDHVTVFKNNGTEKVMFSVEDVLIQMNELGVGELLLNSIDRDGTGFGYDLATVATITSVVDFPVIALAGAGNMKHFSEGLSIKGVNAVATGNLFNFVGDSLPKARRYLLDSNFNLVEW